MIGSAHRTVKRLMGLANLTLLHPVPTLQRSFAMPSKSKTEWSDNTLDPLRAKRPERKGSFGNTSGMEVEPLYATEDVESEAYVDQVGYPGEFPYTRGVQPTMYRGRVWTMRQYAGFASASGGQTRLVSEPRDHGASAGPQLDEVDEVDSTSPPSLTKAV